MRPPAAFAIERLGEDALLLRLGDGIDAACSARVHAWAAVLSADRPCWLRDLVPAYASLALFVDGATVGGDADPLDEAERWLRARLAADAEVAGSRRGGRLVDIPVHYGGDDGPDLAAVAAHAGLHMDDVVALHCGADYLVAMLGFAPGFPYLLGLDPRLATPRREVPRTHVPAGSIGIGGAQTGVYPRAGPGGWQLIGRTAITLFDAARDPPAFLAPGDRVRFVAIGGGDRGA